MDNFGTRLRAVREKQGLTQSILAKKAHTKQDFIAQIENGIRNPSLNTLTNILSALDVSADYMIFGIKAHCGAMNDFMGFLAHKTDEEVAAYYEIVRFMSRFVEVRRDS